MVTDLRKAKSPPKALRTTVLMGLLLRAAALIFILTLGRQFSEPYFLSDDQAYEKLASDYLLHADCFFDWHAFKIIGAVDYLQIFWPIVMGCSSYLLGSIYELCGFNPSMPFPRNPLGLTSPILPDADPKTRLREIYK